MFGRAYAKEKDNCNIVKSGQPSADNTIKLIRGDAQHKLIKFCDRSCNDNMDIWCLKKMCFWRNLKKLLSRLISTS